MNKKYWLGLSIGCALMAAPYAFSADQCTVPYDVSSVVSLDGVELTLVIQDLQPVQNNCDYYIERFSYLQSLHAMDIVMKAPDHCMVDRYGKRKGILKWIVPMTLRGTSNLEIIVNSQHIGSLAVAGPRAEFKPSLTCFNGIETE